MQMTLTMFAAVLLRSMSQRQANGMFSSEAEALLPNATQATVLKYWAENRLDWLPHLSNNQSGRSQKAERTCSCFKTTPERA